MNACFIDQNCCGTTYQGTIINYYVKIIFLSSMVSTLLKSLQLDKTVNLDVSFGFSNHTGHQISITLFIYIEACAYHVEDNSFIFQRKFASDPHCRVNVTDFCFIRIHQAEKDGLTRWMNNSKNNKNLFFLSVTGVSASQFKRWIVSFLREMIHKKFCKYIKEVTHTHKTPHIFLYIVIQVKYLEGFL